MSSKTRRDILQVGALLLGAAAGGDAIGYYRGSPTIVADSSDCSSVVKHQGYDSADRKIVPNKLEERGSNGQNLVLIVCDTFRADCLTSTGYDTPNLDRLASQGVTFANAYGDVFPTGPMRRNLLTGISFAISEAQYDNLWTPIRKKERTLVEYLMAAGVPSLAFITDNPMHWRQFKQGPLNCGIGWDNFDTIRGQVFDDYGDIDRDLNFSEYQPDALLEEEMRDPTSSTFKLFAQYLDNQPLEGGGSTRNTIKRAMKWIEKNAANQFALYLDLYGTHPPFDPPLKFLERYRKRSDFPSEWRDLQRPLWLGHGAVKCEGVTDIEYREIVRDLYRAEIAHMDHCIGELLTKMEQLGLRENTVVVFTSDHGTSLGEGGYLWKSPRLFAPHISQVPLIISPPSGEHNGRIVDSLVSILDIMPTALNSLGIPIGQNPEIDGKNLWELLAGTTDRLHNHLFMRYPYSENYFAVTDGTHYYARDILNNPPVADPMLYLLERVSDQGHIKPRRQHRDKYSLDSFQKLSALLELHERLEKELGLRISKDTLLV